mgnify:FL=1
MRPIDVDEARKSVLVALKVNGPLSKEEMLKALSHYKAEPVTQWLSYWEKEGAIIRLGPKWWLACDLTVKGQGYGQNRRPATRGL